MTVDDIKRNGFIAAGLANIIGVLGSSRFLTNEAIPQLDPVVMSTFGLVMILVWGLAYIAVAKSYAAVPMLAAVFCIEKAIYSAVWIQWQLNNSLSDAFALDFQAGIFYSIYGINDIVFMLFFGWVFLTRAR